MKRVGGLLARGLLIVVLAATAQACTLQRTATSGSGPAISRAGIEYLKSKRQTVDLSKGFSVPSLLDTAVKDATLFLSGEYHGVAELKDLEFGLLRYLHANVGVRYLLVESGYGSAGLIQLYLDSGNEGWLQSSFANLAGTFSYNKEAYDLWKRVYEWNISLAESDRIRVIGIDVEHQYETGIAYLQAILPQDDPTEEIAALVQRLRAIGSGQGSVTGSETKAVCDSIAKSTQTASDIWEDYLGQRFFDFSFTVRDILAGLTFYESRDSGYREDVMFSNFVEVYDHFDQGKYYGQFGQAHTLLEASSKDESLAQMLNAAAGSPVAGKVLSIAVFLEDCESVTDPQTWVVKKYSSQGQDARAFGSAAEPGSDVTLFQLNAGDSPVDSSFYQFAVLIRNGHAITSLAH